MTVSLALCCCSFQVVVPRVSQESLGLREKRGTQACQALALKDFLAHLASPAHLDLLDLRAHLVCPYRLFGESFSGVFHRWSQWILLKTAIAQGRKSTKVQPVNVLATICCSVWLTDLFLTLLSSVYERSSNKSLLKQAGATVPCRLDAGDESRRGMKE